MSEDERGNIHIVFFMHLNWDTFSVIHDDDLIVLPEGGLDTV